MVQVHITLPPGQDATAKTFIARQIAATIAEVTNSENSSVQVIFSEVEGSNWTQGLLPVEAQPLKAVGRRAHTHINANKIFLRPGARNLDAYLDWRRRAVLPFFARHEGFIWSTIMDSEEKDVVIVINKWRDLEGRKTYLADPREMELREEVLEFAFKSAQQMTQGIVLDAWSSQL